MPIQKDFYSSWQEAGKAAIRLGIKNLREYFLSYKKDGRLPCNPNKFYSNFPGWQVFLGSVPKNFYLTWQQASEATLQLKIKSWAEYSLRYKEDKRLPSSPDSFYDNFPGWKKFLRKE